MRAVEIYQKYQLMTGLQLHQIRVAAVATQICQNFSELTELELDKEEILAACLLHDLGNIIKFDLNRFPEMLEPQGIEFWQEVKLKTEQSYGLRVERATQRMLTELEVIPRVKDLVAAIGFSAVEADYRGNDMAKKICAYSDARVAPWGIVSLEERLADLEKRYPITNESEKEKFDVFAGFLKNIEQQIFDQCQIGPGDITNQLESDKIDSLKNFVIPTKG